MVIGNPIIVALDLPSAEAALLMAQRVAPNVGAFKIGLGLLHGPGPGAIDALVRLGLPVFVDAKLHDIPSQVEAAATRLGQHGARWVTAHVSGGAAMLEAAASGLERGSGNAQAGILGVSVLTSLDAADLLQIGFQRTPGQIVGRMAKLAETSGCEGLVCSPLELNVVRQAAPNLVRVTPGIRIQPSDDDQSRVTNPQEAMAKGATYLVIGRPITQAADPEAAAGDILSKINALPEQR